jgi:hypothetical protein
MWKIHRNIMSDNNSVDRDRLRQTCILFYGAISAAALSASITLLGAGELFTGNPQGTVTMMGGLQASIDSLRIARSASDRVKNSSIRSND